MNRLSSKNVYRWALGYLRPYRKQIVFLLMITGIEIVSGLLLPWPLKFIIDYVLPTAAVWPDWMSPIVGAIGNDRMVLLVGGCAAYLVFHLLSEIVSVVHTQMQVGIGQRLIFDL